MYIEKLYEDIKDKAVLDDFITKVMFAGKNYKYRVLLLNLIAGNEFGDSLRLVIKYNVGTVRISFTDYGIKYYQENEVNLDVRTLKVVERYLQYMATNYDGYVEDCLDNAETEADKAKQARIDKLNEIFLQVKADTF